MTTKSGMKKEITKIEKEKEDHEKVTKMEGFKLKDEFLQDERIVKSPNLSMVEPDEWAAMEAEMAQM